MKFVSSKKSSYERHQVRLRLCTYEEAYLSKLDCFGDLAVQVADLFIDVLGREKLAYLSFLVLIFTIFANTFESSATMMTTWSRGQEENALFERLDPIYHFRRYGQPVRPGRARAIVSGCDEGEMAKSIAELLQRVVVAPCGLIDSSVSP
jgi:hypothetical protein